MVAGGASGVLIYALPRVAADPAKHAAVQRVYTGLGTVHAG
jgi:hypothetical protein